MQFVGNTEQALVLTARDERSIFRDETFTVVSMLLPCSRALSHGEVASISLAAALVGRSRLVEEDGRGVPLEV